MKTIELDSVGVDAERIAIPAQKVSLTRVTMLGLSGQQLGPSAAIAAGSIPLYAGYGSWLAMALALLAALCMTAAVNVFARKYVVTGSLLSYVGIALGRLPQRVVAASYLVGFLVVCAALSACFVTFSSSLLHTLGVEFAPVSYTHLTLPTKA